MAAHAYFDKLLARDQAAAVVGQYGGAFLRKKGSKSVYRINGGGEAMIEPADGKLRVRFYAGTCPC